MTAIPPPRPRRKTKKKKQQVVLAEGTLSTKNARNVDEWFVLRTALLLMTTLTKTVVVSVLLVIIGSIAQNVKAGAAPIVPRQVSPAVNVDSMAVEIVFKTPPLHATLVK